MAAWLIVEVEGGVGCLVTKREQEKGIKRETEGAYSILSLMALMMVNKQALFTCRNKMCISTVQP